LKETERRTFLGGVELGRKLATLDFLAYWIRYSPDRTRLRFTVFTLSGRPEDWDIMEIGADGSGGGWSDLLVHSMGKGLADGITQGGAGQQYRSPIQLDHAGQ
jgi:hypothetical protein